MTPPPHNISVFVPGMKEYHSFFAGGTFGEADIHKGTLIKYAPCGILFKAAIVLLFLFLSIGMVLLPDSPLHPAIPHIIAGGFLLLLWVALNRRFDEAWFFLNEDRLIIKRWKYVIPGHTVTIFARKNIESVKCLDNPKGYYKNPQTFTVRLCLKNPNSVVSIMDDTNYTRIKWLTDTLTVWRRKGR